MDIRVQRLSKVLSRAFGAQQNRFMHTEVTRHDVTLGEIFDWEKTPAQDTYKRFFSKFTQAKNHRVSDYFYSWIFDNFKFDNFTLDIDSSVMTRYGVQQEGAKSTAAKFSRGKMQNLLVVSEVTLALVLLVSAGLLIKSFLHLQNTDTGFDKSPALTVQIALPVSRYPDPPKES